MIETAGGMIPFICHVFLILFGGFFGLSFAFNKNFVQNAPGHVVVKDQENLDSLKVKLTELVNQQKHMNG